jgi:predicted pyridoxine 5'-phosphate oxidase superfamily flavin-nucleotide-binding protein
MGKVYERIDSQQQAWIARQPLFFVGTAPLDADGHVNVSPKGPIGSLQVLDDHTVAYLDAYGSGTETIGHLRDNGRIVVMFCAFEGPPRVVRLHGSGQVYDRGEGGFDEQLESFDPTILPHEGVRSVIEVQVTRIADSCGFGVPLMSYEGDRTQYTDWAASQHRRHGPDALRAYEQQNNRQSIDELPGVPSRDDVATTAAQSHWGRKL